MHSTHLSARLSRKSLGLFVLLACALPAMSRAADQDLDPAAAREKAVSQYVAASKAQLDAYRSEITRDTNPSHQQALDAAKDKLANCDRLLEQLKAADQPQFDPVKQKYERARDDLIRSMPSKT